MRSHSFISSSKVVIRSGRTDFTDHVRASLIWCAIALSISPLPGGWLVDRCPLDIRFPEAAISVGFWERANPHPDVLFLGSSRLGSFLQFEDLKAMTKGLLGNDPPIMFVSVFTAGEPVTLDFMTRQLLGSRPEPPRLVVLETHIDLLARDNVYFKDVITRFMTAAELPTFIGDILLNNEGCSRLLSSRLTPFFRHRSHLLAWADQTANRMGANTQFANETLRASEQWADLADHIFANSSFQAALLARKSSLPGPQWERRLNINRQQLATRFRHYELTGATASAFEEMVARLHTLGCRVILVETPLSSAQRALFTRTMQNEFEAFAQRLGRSYGCELFDFSARLPDSLFLDDHHANEQGSRRFTELLTREVIAPAWQQLENRTEQSASSAHR